VSWGYTDEEAERELEAARAEDKQRTSAAQTMGQLLPMRGPVRAVPPQVAVSPAAETPDMRRCPDCGTMYDYNARCGAPNGWRLYVPPSRAGRPVCSGRRDETGRPLSCFERLEAEDEIARTREVHETRLRIRAANERARGSTSRGRGYEP
jgi:hypothetical protein